MDIETIRMQCLAMAVKMMEANLAPAGDPVVLADKMARYVMGGMNNVEKNND